MTEVNGPVTLKRSGRGSIAARMGPWDPGVSAAETLAEIRAAGESV